MRPRNTVLGGHATQVLRGLAPSQFDAVITSPPYFRARNYQAGPGELGQEADVDEWATNLRAVSVEIARVLKPTGSYWLNISDVYSRHAKLGAPKKSLLLAPERLVRGLLADGWIVRGRVAWVKKSPLPSSATDRLTSGWEFVYHLVRSERYFFDLDPIRVPLTSKPGKRSIGQTPTAVLGDLAGSRDGLSRMAAEGRSGHPLGKNPGDVWRLPNGRAIEGHHATFPEGLVRSPILATVPERVCTRCNQAWSRSREAVQVVFGTPQPRSLVPCGCRAATRPGVVLDPFAGSGTVLKVARELGRDAVGVELSERFATLARTRAGFDDVVRRAA